jgi:hypothetical protein
MKDWALLPKQFSKHPAGWATVSHSSLKPGQAPLLNLDQTSHSLLYITPFAFMTIRAQADAALRLTELNLAYEVLSDPGQRAAYDVQLRSLQVPSP